MALEPGGARGLTLAQAIPEVLMQYLFLAGRVLYGGFFLLAGIDHFRHVGMMTPYAAAKGIPAPRLSVLGSGSLDRKSTRLNSSHLVISYAVFCLKKKKNHN